MNQPIASESALSAFLHNLPDTLRQPFSLAVIGSVGAHLFFFLWLPLFTTEETKPDNQRVVRLLNSLPQAQAATSQVGLPPIPKTPNSTVKIPLGQDLNPLIPPDASLYKFQDPILPYSSPIVPPDPPAFRPSRPTTFFQPNQIPQNFNPVPESTAPRSPAQPTPTQSPNSTPPPPSSGQTDPRIANLQSGVTGDPSKSPITPQTPPAPPSTARPGAKAIDDMRRLRDKITYRSPGATPNEVAGNNLNSYGEWFKKNITDRSVPEGSLAEKPIEVTDVPYNLPFNLSEKPEPAYINLLVAPDGVLVTRELTITGHTGYGILDDLAASEVNKLVTIAQKEGTLKPTEDNKGKYVIYKYKVTFKINRAA